MRTIVAVEDVETALLAEVREPQARSIRSSSSQQFELSSVPPPWVPSNFVG